MEATNTSRRRRKPREEELNIVEENTKEELREKFILLREAYDDLKGGYEGIMVQNNRNTRSPGSGYQSCVILVICST